MKLGAAAMITGVSAFAGRSYIALQWRQDVRPVIWEASVKMLRSHLPAVELRARILDHLAGEQSPELADVRIVRGPGDFDPMMPDFVAAYLTHLWR